MNAQLLVLLYRVCRHKAPWTVGRLVALQDHLNKVALHIPANWRRCLTLLHAEKGERQLQLLKLHLTNHHRQVMVRQRVALLL